MTSLSGTHVLVLAADLFEDAELLSTRSAPTTSTAWSSPEGSP